MSLFRIDKYEGEDGWLANVYVRLEYRGHANFHFSDAQLKGLRERFDVGESANAIADAIVDDPQFVIEAYL